ncbi:hypothetical protein Tco_0759206 [Tanacetum coccineum]
MALDDGVMKQDGANVQFMKEEGHAVNVFKDETVIQFLNQVQFLNDNGLKQVQAALHQEEVVEIKEDTKSKEVRIFCDAGRLKHDFYLAVSALPSSRLKYFSDDEVGPYRYGERSSQFMSFRIYDVLGHYTVPKEKEKKWLGNRYHLEEESDFGITKGDLLEKAMRALDLRIHSVDGNTAKPNTP